MIAIEHGRALWILSENWWRCELGLHYISATAELSPRDPEWERIRNCFVNGHPYIDGDMEWIVTRIDQSPTFVGTPLVTIDFMATRQRSVIQKG